MGDGEYYSKGPRPGGTKVSTTETSVPKRVSIPPSNPGVQNFNPPSQKKELARIQPTKMDPRDPNIVSKMQPSSVARTGISPSPAKTESVKLDALGLPISDDILETNSQLNNETPAKKTQALGEILIRKGFLAPELLNNAIEKQKRDGQFLGQALVELGYVSPDQIVTALSEQLHELGGDTTPEIPETVPDVTYEIESAAVQLVPAALAIRASLMPLSIDHLRKVLKVAVVDVRDIQAVDEIRFKTGCEIEFVKVTMDFIEESWKKHYDWNGGRATSRQNESLMNEFRSFTSKLTQDNVSAFVNRVLIRAAELRVSDIHIDPFEDQVSVRFRIDGKLYQAATFSKTAYPTFMGRMKVMANIEITDRKTVIDGRIALKVNEHRQVQFRISIVNSLYGERVVLRIQREINDLPLLADLGLPKVYLNLINKKLKAPHGLVIVTGPTGAGKTTTLYAMVRELCDMSRNIMTIEDPVELALPGASQIAVDAERGHSFAKILRGVLRQDPDVIMVGEIRDEETAQIATRAAMTGHLVFCSLHTNDAPSAITRLSEMGVPSYYLGPALHLILAQRLIRMLCDNCKKKSHPTKQLLFEMGFTPAQVRRDTFYEPLGCAHCNFTGYKGRVPIYEVLDIRQSVREAVTQGKDLAHIRRTAEKYKYLPFLTLLREYMRRGKTSIDEALPYLMDD